MFVLIEHYIEVTN